MIDVGGVRVHYKARNPSPAHTITSRLNTCAGPAQEEVGPSAGAVISGSAPLGLVCLHGFNGSVFSFRSVLKPLADSFPDPAGIRVLAFDRRGPARSGFRIRLAFHPPGVHPQKAYADGVRGRVLSLWHELATATFCSRLTALLPCRPPTRPPFGLTQRPLEWDPQSPNPYSTEGYVKLTLGLLDNLGLRPDQPDQRADPPRGAHVQGGRVVLLGHSAGAQVALQARARAHVRPLLQRCKLCLLTNVTHSTFSSSLSQAALAAPNRIAGVILVSPAIPASAAKEDSFIGKAVRTVPTSRLLIYPRRPIVACCQRHGAVRCALFRWRTSALLLLVPFHSDPGTPTPVITAPPCLPVRTGSGPACETRLAPLHPEPGRAGAQLCQGVGALSAAGGRTDAGSYPRKGILSLFDTSCAHSFIPLSLLLVTSHRSRSASRS